MSNGTSLSSTKTVFTELTSSTESPSEANLTSQGSPTPILPRLTHPAEVAMLSQAELELLAQELREAIIATTSTNGGHLAPSLGVVELTLAMLTVFNPAEDKIVWDVGHQAYAYKLLTGRAKNFHTLRKLGGISGFPKMSESPYDHFGVGHSSTSISAALGMAVARDISGQKHHVVSVIGDGALTAGLAFEGLNQAGATDRPFIVILNDNEMSISKNVGALSLFMSRNLSSRWVRRVKREVEAFLKSVPSIGDDLYEIARRSKHSFKNFFTPGILFEALHFNYIGAVNGHNIEELQRVLRLASTLDKPVLIHVLTQKGKGYKPAEENPADYHGVGTFYPDSGCFLPSTQKGKTYTDAFSDALCRLAQNDERIVTITAAMPDGTGLSTFAKQYPKRFFDVGICEQHAVTFAAGLATQNMRPFVCIYSTFMQRAYDQIIHDVCIQNLPVTLCLDRAGVVGEDGPTHQGAFDLSYLRHIPQLTFFVPKNEAELQQGIATSLTQDGPFAIRYPRGAGEGVPLPDPILPIPIGQAERISTSNCKMAIIAIGNKVTPACAAAKEFADETGNTITVLNARWLKPLPEKQLKEILQTHDKILLVEENSLQGGFSSAVLEFAGDNDLLADKHFSRIGFPDTFLEHGTQAELREKYGLDKKTIKLRIQSMLEGSGDSL